MISAQGKGDWQTLELSSSMGCKGIPVTLIATVSR
jgi:hypothetical protein